MVAFAFGEDSNQRIAREIGEALDCICTPKLFRHGQEFTIEDCRGIGLLGLIRICMILGCDPEAVRISAGVDDYPVLNLWVNS